AVVVASPRIASAQDSTLACHVTACSVSFEWGNTNTQRDPERRYGAPSDMESVFLSRLQELGFKTSRGGEALSAITVRLTPLHRELCDSLSGRDADMSCC